ncbi:dihydrodipicolinate synthase family protein [Enterococcus sp. JM4C]|uniref:dihydrodipicolinate synthase family protein n=1 Tax=Candidatus Enterococcus huntleyi TaxID=1857217 RepID=UPI00137ABC52|nr:dihydrodipicolinate synthase family protein [Enterococcus sp. JM4C]KAF1295104.1 dihydrodipicolinate synthase family protein [Enterococcus sp. JM4C]
MTLMNNYHIAVPTSFDKNEDLNIEATFAHIQYLNKLGIQSVLVCGSTGEQHSLSLNEKLELIDHLSSLKVTPDFELIVGVSSIRQIEAQQLAAKISKVPQISAILIGYSPYILPTQSEALHYTTSIIEAANKQAIIYNNPLRTGFDLSIESYKSLINNHLISGLKEAGDPKKILELKDVIDRPLHYFAGGEKELEHKINLGYNGLSSIAGNLYPNEVKQWFDSLLKNELTHDYHSLKNKIDKLHEKSTLPFIKNEISRTEKIDFGICRTPLGDQM